MEKQNSVPGNVSLELAICGNGPEPRAHSWTRKLSLVRSPPDPGESRFDAAGCVAVQITSPSPSTPPPPVNPPLLKRRCSLTMPYPALYGSWQVQSVQTTGDKVRKSGSSNDAPLAPVPQRHPKSTLKRRWSTLQMDVNPSVVATPSSNKNAGCFQQSIRAIEENQEVDEVAQVNVVETCGTADESHSDSRKPVETEKHSHLITSTLQRLPLKDFGAEVRPVLDVAQFLQQCVLLLDVTENSPHDLVDLLLKKMVPSLADEAKYLLFTHESVPMLARTIQASFTDDSGNFDYDQSWICALCNLPTLQRRHVGIARLKQPANMGHTCHEVRLFVLVLCPSKEKSTKNALETGRTFATLLADLDLKQRLLESRTEEEFKRILLKHTHDLAEEQAAACINLEAASPVQPADEIKNEEKLCQFGRGIREDLARRLPHYLSDYKDGVVGVKTPQKVLSTTLFLYFACILPAIAFGVLNDHNTHGKIDVKKVIIGQTIGGLFYVILSGQPLLILLTTAPLSLYIKIIYSICDDFHLDFYAMYGCVGLWSAFFLILYSLFDVSRLMRWSTRSTEEIFALFISIAFFVDSFRDTYKNFNENYNNPACKMDRDNATHSLAVITNVTRLADGCNRESSLLFLLLMLGTLWIGVSLYNFNKTPYLQAGKREALADYSLPVAVIALSFVGSYVFQDVPLERFRYDDENAISVAPLHLLSPLAILSAMGLGFSLSLLFFMDQNITSAMVNNPCNKLKKGPAYHLDLLVVAVLNAFLSVFGLPWMHATLPHSPLHVRGLADVEERVDQGHVYEIIVRVRETRLTAIISHVLIGLSLLLLPYPLAYIPTAVLDGLFLYMAVTALNGNQMFERITLLFMEQAAYPPNHYIRRVPQRKIHQFTGCQVMQLLAMCLFGFAPWTYMKIMFPLIILLLLPIRHRLVPRLIEARFLEALDGEYQ